MSGPGGMLSNLRMLRAALCRGEMKSVFCPLMLSSITNSIDTPKKYNGGKQRNIIQPKVLVSGFVMCDVRGTTLADDKSLSYFIVWIQKCAFIHFDVVVVDVCLSHSSNLE